MMKMLFIAQVSHVQGFTGIHVYGKKLFNVFPSFSSPDNIIIIVISFFFFGRFFSLPKKWNICYEFEIE
jgi:hypothetical protein